MATTDEGGVDRWWSAPPISETGPKRSPTAAGPALLHATSLPPAANSTRISFWADEIVNCITATLSPVSVSPGASPQLTANRSGTFPTERAQQLSRARPRLTDHTPSTHTPDVRVMSTPRLTFLYPRFIRPFLISEAGATCPSSSSQASRAGVKRRSTRQGQPACRKATDGGAGARAFGTSAHTRLPPGPMQRYGTANEPLPSPPPGTTSDGAGGDRTKGADKAAGEKEGKAAAADGKKDAGAVAGGASKKTTPPPPSQEQDKPQHQGAAQDANAPPKAASPTIFETTSQGEAPNGPPKPARSAANKGNETESNPLEAVLRMPPPTSRPVHLTTPRYVHFFDTWSLVKQLTGSGFSEAQSVSLMKAIRAQLNDNVELAHAGLVGKSDVENETYLFRAACSELRTEVGNNRKAENERMSTQRNQLQHEVDILGQRLGQDTSHLKEEVKGMFDDRKMAVRMEQKSMESKVWVLSPCFQLL